MLRERAQPVKAAAFEPTHYDPAALERLVDAVTPDWKGAPLDGSPSLREFAASGVDALAGGLPLPLLLLRETAVAHNIARMARFAADAGVLLAPHAKTTMSPELIARQIDAGCWAVTAATPAHMKTLRRLGVGRIVLANQLVERSAIRWLAAELARDPLFEPTCLVDSVAGAELLDRELTLAGAPRRLPVLLELGPSGGRAGARGLEAARAVAAAAKAAPALELVGVECFEGLAMDPSRLPAALGEVDAQLRSVHAVAEQLFNDGLLEDRVVSAGGSAFFDRVLAHFPRPEWLVVLRSGCYVSQDGGFYDQASPLAGSGHIPDPLRDALELWGVVLSRPEAGLVVVGAGKRDAPFDLSPPQPVAWRSRAGRREAELDAATVTRLSDQHLTFAIADADGPRVGDLVRFTVSHPCGAFDRWRVISVVDDDRRVVGAVHTAF